MLGRWIRLEDFYSRVLGLVDDMLGRWACLEPLVLSQNLISFPKLSKKYFNYAKFIFNCVFNNE